MANNNMLIGMPGMPPHPRGIPVCSAIPLLIRFGWLADFRIEQRGFSNGSTASQQRYDRPHPPRMGGPPRRYDSRVSIRSVFDEPAFHLDWSFGLLVVAFLIA